MTDRGPFLPSLLLLLLPSCAATSLVVDGATGEETRLSRIADALAEKDVVVIGEEHRNAVGHGLQLQLVRELYARHPDLVVSMEMFERDVQGLLDDYLRGRIDEEAFLAGSRPWPNYREHYRPIVELARRHGLPVLAANMPRELARKVSREGPDAIPPGPHVARETTAPRNAYWEAFQEAMSESTEEHGEMDEATTYRVYQAQCFKDDTMAETIADYLAAARREGRDPLIVHLCGRFHSERGLGTVARLRRRAPDAAIGTVTMEAMEQVALPELGDEPPADYVLVVREEPERERPAGSETAAAKAEAPGEPESRPSPHAAPRPGEGAEHEPAAGGRPALGFMPDYQAEGGLGVGPLREGGPAERAGVREGDLIVAIDGLGIADIHDYVDVLRTVEIGETIEVVVRRDGRERTLQVVVGTR